LVIGLGTPASVKRQQALREVSETLCIDNPDGLPAPTTGVALSHVLQELHRREVNEVHVEAGPRLNGSLLAQSWVDEMLLYVAPMLLGPGQSFASLAELQSLPRDQEWGFVGTDTLGCDMRLLLRRLVPTCDTACR
jgi:diaminohydroxyphosphoribosylaminopyrimidine deaminase / 5-amino-6-(5-phosphoribosylamino)uracil reductase